MNILYRLFLFCVFNMLALNNIYAEQLYKQVPFTVSLAATDTLTVQYDFSAKNGVQCTSHPDKVWIDFMYKGRHKGAMLPVILQSAHVPQKDIEELADVNGQITIVAQDEVKSGENVVKCEYLN
jgi:hypothetical protein